MADHDIPEVQYLGKTDWRPPLRQREGLEDWARRHLLQGGGGDLRNILMSLPFGRQASAVGAAAPRALSASQQAKQGGSVVEQVLKDWKTQRGNAPQSDSEWQRISEMAKERLRGRAIDTSRLPPSLSGQVGKEIKNQYSPAAAPRKAMWPGMYADQINQTPEQAQPPMPGGGLGALLPALAQSASSMNLQQPMQQAQSGFDQFLNASPEMEKYFLDL